MKTERLKVSGMTCGGCVGTVTSAVQSVDGVKDVNVSLSAGRVTVRFEEQRASMDQIRNSIRRAGYTVGDSDLAPKPAGGGCCCA